MIVNPIVTVGVMAVTTALVPVSVPVLRHELAPHAENTDAVAAPKEGYKHSGAEDTVVFTAASSGIKSVALHGPWEVNVLRQKEVSALTRLYELTTLSAGWSGGKSKAPNATLLSWLTSHLSVLSPPSAAISIVPASDGSIVLEWAKSPFEFTAELHPDQSMLLVADNTDTDELSEGTFGLNEDILVRFISSGSFA